MAGKKKEHGRPTKFKPEYCEMLEEHMASGLGITSFAAKIKVNPDTLYEWERVHKSFSESIKKGKALEFSYYEKMGLAGAAGKIKGFNVAAWIFIMKNKCSWRDRQEVQHSGNGAPIKIVIDEDDNAL